MAEGFAAIVLIPHYDYFAAFVSGPNDDIRGSFKGVQDGFLTRREIVGPRRSAEMIRGNGRKKIGGPINQFRGRFLDRRKRTGGKRERFFGRG